MPTISTPTIGLTRRGALTPSINNFPGMGAWRSAC